MRHPRRAHPIAVVSIAAISGAVLCLAAPSASATATGHTGSGRPGLAVAGGRLYVAWTGSSGTPASKQINLGYTTDGGVHMAKVSTTQRTPATAGPALDSDGTGVYMAWPAGDGTDTLTVAYYDGTALTCLTSLPGRTTAYSPALATDGSGTDYLAWTDAGGSVQIGTLDSSACASGGTMQLTDQVTLAATATAGPALVYDTSGSSNLGIVLAWTAPGAAHTISVGSYTGGSVLTNQSTVTAPVGSTAESGLGAVPSDLYLAFLGTDGTVYLSYSEGCIPTCFDATSLGVQGSSGVGMASDGSIVWYAYFDTAGQLQLDSF